MTAKPRFPADPTERAIVVGGGIAGLTAAFRLRQRGFQVTVLEASETIAGKMGSRHIDGFIVNRAANILPSSYTMLLALADDLGIADSITGAVPILAVPRDGDLYRIQASGTHMAVDGARTRLLSLRSKLLLRHLVADALRMRRSLSYESLAGARRFDIETVGEYCTRRLNSEIREYLVEPIVRALFTSNVDDISVVDFFFAAVNFIGSGLMQYSGGIDFLCREIARHVDVRTSARVNQVGSDPSRVQVSWTDAAGDHVDEAAGCIIAVSGADVPGLYPQLDPVQLEILRDHLRYCVTYVTHFALDRRPDEPALVVPMPRTEDDDLCVLTFGHNISPTAAPPGKGLVSSYWLHEWSVARETAPDEEILDEAAKRVARYVPEVDGHLRFSALDRWSPAVVRSYPGWYAQVARFEERIDRQSRVQLAGDYLSASSTNACAVSGDVSAKNLEHAVFGTDTLRRTAGRRPRRSAR